MPVAFTNHAQERLQELYGEDVDPNSIWVSAVRISSNLMASLTCRSLEKCQDQYYLTDDQRGVFVVIVGEGTTTVITVIRLGLVAQKVLQASTTVAPPLEDPIDSSLTVRQTARRALERQLTKLLGRPVSLDEEVQFTAVQARTLHEHLAGPDVILEAKAVQTPSYKPGRWLRFFEQQAGKFGYHTVRT